MTELLNPPDLKQIKKKKKRGKRKPGHSSQLRFNTKFLKAEKEKGTLTCHYCGKPNLKIVSAAIKKTKTILKTMATADHVIPVSKGGAPKDISNLVVACHACNFKKADKLPDTKLHSPNAGDGVLRTEEN